MKGRGLLKGTGAMWQRARTEEQIGQRVDAIVRAAGRLYERVMFDDITFAMIAREADFSRSNMYKYFETKEDVFLAIMCQDMTVWREDVAGVFGGEQKKEWGVRAFCERWVEVQLGHERMMKLFAIVHTRLERNCSAKGLVGYKKHLLLELRKVEDVVRELFRFRDEGAVVRFLYGQLMMMIGAQPIWDLTEKQVLAMGEAGMDTNIENYKAIYVEMVEAVLRGVIEE